MDITESVQALLNSHERIVERFYERFLQQYPELRHHFETRDMAVQASIVTMGLVSVEAYYTNRFPATEHYLKVLGHRHFHNGVREEDFPRFRDVLLETLKDFHGSDWDDTLHRAWREAFDLSVSVMLEGYTSVYTM